jgi:type I restriction enzyme S subunit
MSSDLDNRRTLEDFGLTSLPVEWRVPVVGDLLGEDRGISVGVMYPGEHCAQGIPLVKAGDLRSNWINPNPPFRITPDKHYEYRRTELDGGELLISLVGNTGQTAVVPPRMKGWNVARAVAVVRLGVDANPHYVKYALQSPSIGQLMKSWCNTTVQETLNLKEIKQIPIPVPEITEQKAIAHILGTLDDKIELNRKTNETLEAMAKALFKSWFVDFDPVRAKAEGRSTGLPDEISDLFPDSFEDSELGEIPSGWDVTEIGHIVTLRKDSIDPSLSPEETFDHYSIPAFDAGKSPAKELGSSIKSQKFLIGEDDLLVSKLNPSIPRVWIPFSSSARRSICSTEFLVCQASTDVGRALAYCLASSDSITEVMTGLAGGTSNSHQRIRPSDFLALDCCIGPQKVRSAFSDVVEPLLRKTLSQRIESRTLASARDALLPKLISGEIRIPEAERLVSNIG